MKSFSLSRTHSMGHENVNCRGISSPPEGIGDGLQFNDFMLPVVFPFSFFDEKVDIPRNFSRNVTNSFPSIKTFLFFFYVTSIWINCNQTLVGFDFKLSHLPLDSTKLSPYIRGTHVKQLPLESYKQTLFFLSLR